ncbi:hypothetical protein B0J13DRAFT_676689 [Dactylonectria estremocensis]|uniref:F-box domain-containing protein n=1 Tax=Dactylonectria estremocensis TaxID=1079267 RepID=A0A9P9ENH5_9HYPO|nr:hypothetical protein B0J13DRAFT_676689 [Dactylonectria estremocensis]
MPGACQIRPNININTAPISLPFHGIFVIPLSYSAQIMSRDIVLPQSKAMAVATSAQDTLSLQPASSRSCPRTERQPRITDFFASTGPWKSAPRVSFLDLLKHVRERIYDESNIGGEKFINLNSWIAWTPLQWQNYDDEQLNSTSTDSDVCLCRHGAKAYPGDIEEPFPAALLWAGSRLIHDEVEAKLYAQNTFAVNLVMRDSLRPLEMLSDAALSHLRALVVSLQPCRCLTPFCDKERWVGADCNECRPWPRPLCIHFWEAIEIVGGDRRHARALGMLSRTDKQTLARWKRICGRLASHVTPGQLKFYLFAEAADLEAAHAIIDPLEDMPVLKEASICLSETLQGDQLSSLARSAALRLMNKLQCPPFRFMDLPPELHLQILNYTDLTAYRFVTWDPERKFQVGTYKWIGDTDDGPYGHLINHQCMDDGYSLNDEHFCMTWQRTAFSPRCRCHERPVNYFLVSKAFSAAARSVFYARNEFRLLPFTRLWKSERRVEWFHGSDDDFYKLPLASFLRSVPPNLTSNFTHITLVFPPLAPTYLWSEPSSRGGWDEWVQAIDDLAQRAHLPRLKLEVHFADQDPKRMERVDAVNSLTALLLQARLRQDLDTEEEMMETYERVLAPLKRLGPKLCDLFIYVAWPMYPLLGDNPFAFETGLEKEIMGQGYESYERGKYFESPYTHPIPGTL